MARAKGAAGRREAPSLRTELLFNLAFQAAGALLLAVVSAALVPLFWGTALGLVLLAALVVADVAIFIVLGRYLIARLITRPMDALVEATQAVAEGELGRRAPPGGTRELDRLAASVNRMTERLLDAQGLLLRAEKLASVGRLAAGIAHEVGNPLASIGNYVEVLRRRGADSEIVAAIEREIARIDTIVKSLLDYARPRGGQRDPLDVGDVVSGAVALLDAQGVLRAVALETDIGASLPPVSGDRAALEQVIVNLLLNAVDAAGAGGRVVARAEAAGAGGPLRDAPAGAPAVRIVVEDGGPGVPDDVRERVFDPFYTTKAPGHGTGLGLAIVQRIVHDHGGRVDVGTSSLGGAAFAVTLPSAGAT